MAYQMMVEIKSISDERNPAVVTTDRGTFQLKRGMTRVHYQGLLRALRKVEANGGICVLKYIPQTKASGSRHTLIGIAQDL